MQPRKPGQRHKGWKGAARQRFVLLNPAAQEEANERMRRLVAKLLEPNRKKAAEDSDVPA